MEHNTLMASRNTLIYKYSPRLRVQVEACHILLHLRKPLCDLGPYVFQIIFRPQLYLISIQQPGRWILKIRHSRKTHSCSIYFNNHQIRQSISRPIQQKCAILRISPSSEGERRRKGPIETFARKWNETKSHERGTKWSQNTLEVWQCASVMPRGSLFLSYSPFDPSVKTDGKLFANSWNLKK